MLDQCREISDQHQNSSTSALSITIDGLEAFSTYKVEVAGRANSVVGEIEDVNGTTLEMGKCLEKIDSL